MERHLDKVLPLLKLTDKKTADGRVIAWCPFHEDGKGQPPHQANLLISDRGFICHACGENGSLKTLAARLGVEAETHPTFVYRNADTVPTYRIVRRPRKKFVAQHRNGAGVWENGMGKAPRILYRLDEIEKASPEKVVHVVEGEKDADRLAENNLLATTNPFGAGKWLDQYSDPLTGRDVVILPDNDGPGENHALTVAKSLWGKARTIKIVHLPDLLPKGDVSDWLNKGHTIDEMRTIIENTPELDFKGLPADESIADSEPGSPDGTITARLIELVEHTGADLFCDELGIPFIRFPVGDRRETWPLAGEGFSAWASRLLYESEGRVCRTEALNSVRLMLGAKARFEGPRLAVHNRVAPGDGCIWVDMSDLAWRVVRVDQAGWKVATEAPVIFRRYRHQKPQVDPVPGGDLNELRKFVNIDRDDHWILLKTYLVSTLIPGIAHPPLLVSGPSGSAKTSLCRCLRTLIDPSVLSVMSLGREMDLPQNLAHHWMAIFDNASSISQSVSDLFCRAVTGEGFSKRMLYADDDDVVYHFRRCIGLTGINLAARNSDLLERSLLIELPRIGKEQRRTEAELDREFAEARPRLFGSVLTALSRAMAIQPEVKIDRLPRMADFAVWGYAIAQALGDGGEAFLSAYAANSRTRSEHALLESPAIAALQQLLNREGEWVGTARELLSRLDVVALSMKINRHGSEWPKQPNALTRQLNELAPALAAVGILYSARHTREGSMVQLRRVEPGDDGV